MMLFASKLPPAPPGKRPARQVVSRVVSLAPLLKRSNIIYCPETLLFSQGEEEHAHASCWLSSEG